MKNLLVLICMLWAVNSFALTPRTLDGAQITVSGSPYTLQFPALMNETLTGNSSTSTLIRKSMDGSQNTFSNIPTTAIAGGALSGSNTGDATVDATGTTNGLSISVGQVFNLNAASASQNGALTSSDWSTFNGKQAALGFTAVPNTRQVNGHALSADVTVTKSDVGLSAVSNDAQVKVSDFNAKGDILIGTGAGAYGALGVGTDGYIPTASSTSAKGIVWAPAAVTTPNIFGSEGSPILISIAGFTFSGTNPNNVVFIAGNAGPIIVTANPQISVGTVVGARLVLSGTHATNTVQFQDGNGLKLNGTFIATNQSSIELYWTGSVWRELGRF